ncbi:hypothetical protein PpBr36_02421 [Pyricularia pennisetigena]|uniref:hypothetical protein n=1 Tax=Pyricularia pennisetigena TaxID=1578925 RepID=UPI00114F2399|nr:hypothetical protein PpBr36_02421 [Pyricularia pennisetigena]TLS30333.1 hypothetical protein PpBr36_02421 [Pyricularia pennisetigena]
MSRSSTWNRKKYGREASEPMEESDAILLNKTNNDGARLCRTQTKVTPARRRRRSARPNARRQPMLEWDDPNLNPGLEDLRPPSSQSEEEDEDYKGVPGLGRRTAARNSWGRYLVQSARQSANHTMRREETADSVQMWSRDQIPSGNPRRIINHGRPAGESSSTASAPSTAKEEKLKQSIGKIEDRVKILKGREANWKRAEAGAMQHLAGTIEAWHAQDPTIGLASMQALPHNTPTCARLLLWMTRSIKKKETAGRELKPVQDELARAQHHAGVLRREIELVEASPWRNLLAGATGVADPEIAEAERYAEWAYQQTLRGDTGVESMQSYEGAVRHPDPTASEAVVLDAVSNKNGDGQSPPLVNPVRIVGGTRPPPPCSIHLDRRWNPSLGPPRFDLPVNPSPPGVCPDQQLNTYQGNTRSDQRLESNSTKRKRESERQHSHGDGDRWLGGTGGPDASSDRESKRRKMGEEMDVYLASELDKIYRESAAWKAGFLNWVVVKARLLLFE